MRKFLIIALIGIYIIQPAFTQSKVTEKFILGNWKLNIDIEEELREAEQEAEDSESLIAEIVTNTVTGALSGFMKRLDIEIQFRENGEARVVVELFDNREIEYTTWYIDKNGRLHLDDIEDLKTDVGAYWLRDGDVLISMDSDEKAEKNVYLTRIKK